MTGRDAIVETERELGHRIATRVRDTRRLQGLSFDELARLSGLSKGTVVGIEQGKANPSIGVLCKLAAAFGISVSDLVGERFSHLSDSPVERTVPAILWTSASGSQATLTASLSGTTMFELWSWTLMPGESYRSDAHSPGTHELISVQSGALAISVGNDRVTLDAGAAARLSGDQAHSYTAVGDDPALFTMAVLERGMFA